MCLRVRARVYMNLSVIRCMYSLPPSSAHLQALPTLQKVEGADILSCVDITTRQLTISRIRHYRRLRSSAAEWIDEEGSPSPALDVHPSEVAPPDMTDGTPIVTVTVSCVLLYVSYYYSE